MTSRFPAPIALLALAACLEAVAAEPLPHGHLTIDLPGPPVAVIPADLDGDGRMDLVVPLVYTEYEEIEFEQAKGFVQITEIVPALFERRELRAWLGQPDGSYLPAGPPQTLEPSVIWIGNGPPSIPVMALTDSGLARVSLGDDRNGPTLVFETIVDDPPVMRGAGTYLPGLVLSHELDGDGAPDILLPAGDGPAIYRFGAAGIEPEAVARLVMPGDHSGSNRRENLWRVYPLPEPVDVDADGLPDLVLIGSDGGGAEIAVFKGLGGGAFAVPVAIDTNCLRTKRENEHSGELAFFGDLDGEGSAEVVLKHESSEDDGFDEARDPHVTYRFYHLTGDMTLQTEPYEEVEVIGHAVGGNWPRSDRGEFRDLNGDGRRDLVTVSLDFSMWQVLRVLTTKKFGMGLEFHVWMQEADGGFTQTSDRDLQDKLLLDLNDLRFDRLDHFSGDFNGDGLFDFVNLKRGDKLNVHFMEEGGGYGKKPDRILRLENEPLDMRLLWIRDLDDDGITDLGVTRPLPSSDDGATAPVILDLYVSGRRP